MAVSQEDIKPGRCWLPERMNGDLFIAQVSIASSVGQPAGLRGFSRLSAW
jgi:hypothetical protein